MKSKHTLSKPMQQEAQKDTSKDMEESKKGEKKKEISVLTSKFNQTRIYQRFGNNAVKLEKMPDYSN